MPKYSGKNGYLLYNSAVNISDANHVTGVVTIDTASAHGLTQNDLVFITGVVGMTDLNGYFKVATVSDADTFTVSLTTAQSYTSGGSVRNAMAITDWSGTIEGEIQDVTDSTSASAGWEESIPNGWSRASGSISGFVLDGHNRPAMQTTMTLQLNYDSTDFWSGSVILTNQTIDLKVKGTDAVKVAYNFIGTGEFAETVN